VAKGSSVPVCPARRTPRDRRTWSTTSWEVGPVGLSTTSTPSRGGLFVVVFAGRRLRLRVVDLVEQPRDAVAGLEPLVVLEEELRGMPQAQPLAQRAAHVAGGLLEPGQAGLALLLGAQHADEDAGLAEVRPEADARDGHEADAGILELARDHLRDFFADLLSEAFRPPSHRISVLTSTTWMSRARSA